MTAPAPQLDDDESPLELAWRIVADFWIKPVRAEPVALMRILTGLCVLASALTTVLPNLRQFWFDDGWIPTAVADGTMQWNDRFSVLAGVTSPAAVVAWFVVWIVALVCVIVGCFTRVACFVAWLMTLSFNMRAYFTLNGGDDVAVMLLFYLMLAPAGAAWSVDSLRRHAKRFRQPASGFESPAPRQPPPPAMIAPWAVRLMQIQLVLVYFLNGINKLNMVEADGRWSNDYIDGVAVYWAMNDLTLTRWSFAQFPMPLIASKLLSWATLVFEIGFPLFVLVRRLRPVLLIGGVLFHLGIFVTMEIAWFGQMTLCYYPVFFSAALVSRLPAWLAGAKRGVKYRVCYDTFCPICRQSRWLLEGLDAGRRLAFRDIHDRQAMAREAPGVGYARALAEMIVIAPDGRTAGGFDAFRMIARVLPALWPVLPLLYVPGVAQVGRRVYKWVARNRYRLVKCDGICSLHLMALSRPNLSEEDIAKVVQQARAAAGVLASDGPLPG